MKAHMDDVHFARAGRKSICASVRKPRPVHEGHGLGKRSKLKRQIDWWSKEHYHWAKEASHRNATNHDGPDTL
jgi:hypothetical protein